MAGFYVGTGDLNSDPYVCTNTLPTESFSLPQVVILLKESLSVKSRSQQGPYSLSLSNRCVVIQFFPWVKVDLG